MKSLLTSLKIFMLLSLLTGIIYPILITGAGQLIFPYKANGSLIIKEGKTIGSELIGQKFDSINYFSSRPSSINYNPLPSGGSNSGLTSKKLQSDVAGRKSQFISFNKTDSLTRIPSEMLFASASGLDPHISPEATSLQIERIAEARHLSLQERQKLTELITSSTKYPQFGILGQKCVNVLQLNLALDQLKFDNTQQHK